MPISNVGDRTETGEPGGGGGGGGGVDRGWEKSIGSITRV